MTPAPPPDLDALAAAAQTMADDVGRACDHPPARDARCGCCDGCYAHGTGLTRIRAAAPELARGLLAAVDALRDARTAAARVDATAGEVADAVRAFALTLWRALGEEGDLPAGGAGLTARAAALRSARITSEAARAALAASVASYLGAHAKAERSASDAMALISEKTVAGVRGRPFTREAEHAAALDLSVADHGAAADARAAMADALARDARPDYLPADVVRRYLAVDDHATVGAVWRDEGRAAQWEAARAALTRALLKAGRRAATAAPPAPDDVLAAARAEVDGLRAEVDAERALRREHSRRIGWAESVAAAALRQGLDALTLLRERRERLWERVRLAEGDPMRGRFLLQLRKFAAERDGARAESVGLRAEVARLSVALQSYVVTQAENLVLREVAEAAIREHEARAAWLAGRPACASAPPEVLAAEAATAAALANCRPPPA